MPDSFDNWTPDDQFWNDAWSDMKNRLDKDEKTRPAYWRLAILLLFVVSGFAAWSLMGQASENEGADEDMSKRQEVVASSKIHGQDDSNLKEENGSSNGDEIADIRIHPQEKVVFARTSSRLLDDEPSKSKLAESYSDHAVLSSINNSKRQEQYTKPDEVLTSRFQEEILPAPAGHASAGGEVQILKTAPLSNPLFIPTIALHEVEDAKPRVTFKKRRNLSYGLSILASQGTSIPGFGYGLSFGSSFSLGDKWSLVVDAFLRQEQVPLRFGAGDPVAEEMSNQSPIASGSFDQLERALEQENLDYGRFLSLGLEPRLYRSISDKWRLSVGANVHYILDAVSPAADFSNLVSISPPLVDRSAFTNADLTNNLNNFLAANSLSQDQATTVSLSRWQLEVVSGIDLQMSSRWHVGADLRYRATDYFDDSSFRFGKWRGQLRLGYRL